MKVFSVRACNGSPGKKERVFQVVKFKKELYCLKKLFKKKKSLSFCIFDFIVSTFLVVSTWIYVATHLASPCLDWDIPLPISPDPCIQLLLICFSAFIKTIRSDTFVFPFFFYKISQRFIAFLLSWCEISNLTLEFASVFRHNSHLFLYI